MIVLNWKENHIHENAHDETNKNCQVDEVSSITGESVSS